MSTPKSLDETPAVENESLLEEETVGIDESPAPECRDLSIDELTALIASAAVGRSLTEEQRINVRNALTSLSNELFRTVIRVLDRNGVLQTALQELYASEPSADERFEVPVLCYRFWNARDVVDEDIRLADAFYSPQGISIRQASTRVVSKSQAETVVGHGIDENFELNRAYDNSSGQNRFTNADMQAVLAAYVPKTSIAGLWVKNLIRPSPGSISGTSAPEFVFGSGYHKMVAVGTDNRLQTTFTHELGHVLINEGHSPAGNLMQSSGDNNLAARTLTNEQVTRIKASALGWVRAAR